MVTLIFYFPTLPSLFLQAANWVPPEESVGAHNPRKSRTGRRKSADASGLVVVALLATQRKSVPLLRSLDQAGATGSTTEQ